MYQYNSYLLTFGLCCPAILLQKKQNHWQNFFNLGHLHNISFNFFNSFWPTVRIQYDPISHYSPHLNFSFFAVVINSVLRSSQLENVTKTTKCQMWSASLKLSSHLLPFRTREELKFQIEDQNRWDVRLLWGTIAGKNMNYQLYVFLWGYISYLSNISFLFLIKNI